jgi:hypothetical protein
MKVRMSYEVDVERIPHEMEKTKSEIVSLLAGAAESLAAAKVSEVEKTEESKSCISEGISAAEQAINKLTSLLSYVDNHKQIAEKIKNNEVEERALEIANERSQEMQEELKQVIDERTKEFNEIIKKREDMIAELQQRLAGAEKPAPKKKATRKKKSVTK